MSLNIDTVNNIYGLSWSDPGGHPGGRGDAEEGVVASEKQLIVGDCRGCEKAFAKVVFGKDFDFATRLQNISLAGFADHIYLPISGSWGSKEYSSEPFFPNRFSGFRIRTRYDSYLVRYIKQSLVVQNGRNIGSAAR